jgi:hypothetical protein
MSPTPAFAGKARLKYDIAIMFMSAPAFLLSGCQSSGRNAEPEGGTCPAGQVLRYESPGCAAEATPVCGASEQDACYRAVCSCQGQTISRCDYAPEPFAAFGECSAPDSGTELPMDPAVDSGIDVAADGPTDIAVPDGTADSVSDGAGASGDAGTGEPNLSVRICPNVLDPSVVFPCYTCDPLPAGRTDGCPPATSFCSTAPDPRAQVRYPADCTVRYGQYYVPYYPNDLQSAYCNGTFWQCLM